MTNRPNLLLKEIERNGRYVKITETIEKNFTREDLMQQVAQHSLQQERIRQQMDQMKQEYERLQTMKDELEQIITEYTDDGAELPEII